MRSLPPRMRLAAICSRCAASVRFTNAVVSFGHTQVVLGCAIGSSDVISSSAIATSRFDAGRMPVDKHSITRPLGPHPASAPAA